MGSKSVKYLLSLPVLAELCERTGIDLINLSDAVADNSKPQPTTAELESALRVVLRAVSGIEQRGVSCNCDAPSAKFHGNGCVIDGA